MNLLLDGVELTPTELALVLYILEKVEIALSNDLSLVSGDSFELTIDSRWILTIPIVAPIKIIGPSAGSGALAAITNYLETL